MREINCGNIEELALVCATLTREGLTFEANTTTLKIKLTGGF
jgi:hypothetical protein